MLNLPDTSVLLSISTVPDSVVLPYTLASVPTASLLVIPTPPLILTPPSTPNDPVIVWSLAFVRLVIPVTPRVELICDVLPTVNVPTILLLPLSVSTVNLLTPEPFWIKKFSLEALITS